MRHRLGADRQQLDGDQLPDGPRADRRVRGPGVRVGGHVQRRVLPGAAVGPARRLHGAGRAVRVPGRVVARLRADRGHRAAGHRRVVRAHPAVRAREPGVAGVARPRRRRRLLQTQAEARHARGTAAVRRRRRRRCRGPRVPATRPRRRHVPAVPDAVHAFRAAAAVRSAGAGDVRRAAGGRLGRPDTEPVFRSRRAGRVPGGRQPGVRGHAPPGIVGHAVGRRHGGRRPAHRRVQPGPLAPPQPSRFAAAQRRAALRPGHVHGVQQHGPGAQRARQERPRRTRRHGVQLRRRVPRHQDVSVRPFPAGLVGVRVVRRRGRAEHRFRRIDVSRHQTQGSGGQESAVCPTDCLTTAPWPHTS